MVTQLVLDSRFKSRASNISLKKLSVCNKQHPINANTLSLMFYFKTLNAHYVPSSKIAVKT